MTTFRQLVTQLPTDVFVDCLPQSLPLLEVTTMAEQQSMLPSHFIVDAR